MTVHGIGETLNPKNNTITADPETTQSGTVAQTVAVPFIYNARNQYFAIFFLRGTQTHPGTLNIIDSNGQIVNSQKISLSSTNGKTWTQQSLSVPVNKNEKFSFFITWNGLNILEIGPIRVI